MAEDNELEKYVIILLTYSCGLHTLVASFPHKPVTLLLQHGGGIFGRQLLCL